MPEPNTNKILDCIEEENEEWEIIPLEMEEKDGVIDGAHNGILPSMDGKEEAIDGAHNGELPLKLEICEPERRLKTPGITELNLRKEQVNEIFKKVRAARNLDLCFLVDVTASMESYIAGVKNSIRNIVDKLTSKSEAVGKQSIVKKIRLAFVGYRDFGDKPQFAIFPFNHSVNQFHKFCESVKAFGGDDAPEDVFGGLFKALWQLSWKKDGWTRMLFHIADCPCHGREFHSYPVGLDFYPNGDPRGSRAHTLKSLFDRINGEEIQYFFGKITNETDIMLEKFSTVYNGEIVVCDLKNADRIFESVVSTTSMAVTRVCDFPGQPKLKFAITFDKEVPKWSEIYPIDIDLLSYESPKTMDDITSGGCLKKEQIRRGRVQIAKNPFAKGVERVAFYGRVLSFYEEKKPKHIVLKRYFGQKGFVNSAKQCESAIQLQTIAAFMATKFNDELLKKTSGGYPIKFLKAQLASYVNKNEERIYMTSEWRYHIGSEFHRFTNNINYAMLEETANMTGVDVEFLKQLLAFSHWTYQVSDGYLMVVDLQGVISFNGAELHLTDPAIHCTDLLRFGRTNLGERGMQEFFNHHACNEVCRKMGLVVPAKFTTAANNDDD